jgi:hypothetical protein
VGPARVRIRLHERRLRFGKLRRLVVNRWKR